MGESFDAILAKVRAGAPHAGDCTKQAHTCFVCLISDFEKRADAFIAALRQHEVQMTDKPSIAEQIAWAQKGVDWMYDAIGPIATADLTILRAVLATLQQHERDQDELKKWCDLRRVCAVILGCDPETWPEHGNATLAIAASLQLQVNERGRDWEQHERMERVVEAARHLRRIEPTFNIWDLYS